MERSHEEGEAKTQEKKEELAPAHNEEQDGAFLHQPEEFNSLFANGFARFDEI